MDRRVQKTKAAIRQAYFSLLMEKKSRKMTVTELARRANIDRKTFYLHYDTTDEVLKDYHQELTRKLLGILREQDFFTQQFDMTNFYSAINQVVNENMDLFRQIALMDCANWFWKQSLESLIKGICDIYQEKCAVPRQELCLYSRFILTGTLEIYQQWLRGNLPVSLEELGRMTTNVALFGFSSALKSGKQENSENTGGF
ncbi:MAG: TetR/AcrR family transcriptional regulator [Oscillospiraceae bacterium]|nr:TetR/AcrR family transcriptional regulator [Oscillospiraceae bacterium]